MGLFQGLVSLKMTEIFLAWVPASSGCHRECQADRFKSCSIYWVVVVVVCGVWEGWRLREDREEEEEERTRQGWRGAGTEEERDGESECLDERGLMSNERLTRPQLILSLHLCFGASLSTKVITTPSSIILLSPLFTGNCLILCYRFVLLRIILSVIRGVSCGKHTAPFLPDALWGLSWVTPSGCSQNLKYHFFFSRHKEELPWLICHCQSTTSHSGPLQRWNRFLSAPLNEGTCKFMLMRAFCDPGSPLGAERVCRGW